MGEVVVCGWNAIDEIFQDEGEGLDEGLGFFGERDGFVVYGGDIELVEDAEDFCFFGGGFICGNRWIGLEGVLVLGGKG